MTTLVLGATPTWSQRVTGSVAGWLSARTSRRGFLQRTAVVGSALAVDTVGFVLKPQSAYASVCGPGSSCSTGWTVFCATVNKGVNACPPGSIAAGWWKADGASLCGGKARYIIDCNATCSRCSTPSGKAGICAPSCWSCSCTCGPAGQCDQRRVCCNGFRYGQCNQQVRQVGSVLCRVVSCRAPWTFEKCSSAPATDNNTRDHNSPALPTAWSAITARYVALGDLGGPLGATVNAELAVPGGRAQRYTKGRMSWSSATGAHHVLGDVAARYTALGAEAGVLGLPTADPVVVDGGSASAFQRGRISAHPDLGAFETLGPVAVRYTQAGAEGGRLGFPVATPRAAADGVGRGSAFQRGRISWHPDTGAHLMGAAIARRYTALGAEDGRLGYPVLDEAGVQDGVLALELQHGRIVWTAATGAVAVHDTLAAAHTRAGGVTGPLGWPVAAERPVGPGTAQAFRSGHVSAGPRGTFFVSGALWSAYDARGAELGPLGWPVADEVRPASGQRRLDCERGSLLLDEVSGTVTQS